MTMKSRLVCGTVALVWLLSGCGASTPKPAAKPTLPAVAVPRELGADEMGKALVSLLRADRRKGQKSALATSIVRRQLVRAKLLFHDGERDAALRAVRGALFLVKAGEARPEMWVGSEEALALAAEEAARLGNEGRARALYTLLKQSKPSTVQVASADEHLAAMDQFADHASTDRELELAGDAERSAVERSNYEPSQENLDEASKKIAHWIRTALASDVLERWGEAAFDRQEAIEAYRARRYGAMTLVATQLRHGDPMGALDWLEKNDLGRLVPAELRSRLEQAGEDDDVNAWGQLFQFFQSETDSSRAESTIGTELAQAAAFGLAVELYRSHPDSLVATGPIALMLPDYQMGDAVPDLLLSAMGTHPTREELSWALSLFMRAVLTHGDAGDLEAARRIFKSGEPILAQAEVQLKKGEPVRPHPARLYRVMATLESRAADLARASAALGKALELEPNALGYVELGRVVRQRGDSQAAQGLMDQAIALAKTSDDALGAAEALTAKYELLLERGEISPAESVLRAALDAAMGARDKAQRPLEQAQAERRYARVLELYGKFEGAERASHRALTASRADAQQLSVTILDSARRALVTDDLRAARSALKDAQEYGLSGEDCTYVALWVRILERRRRLASDGSVEEVLSKLGELAYWPAKLRALLLGQLTDSDLSSAPRKETERVELAFYRAMLAPNADANGALAAVLADTAKSAAVGLVEVAIAQDLARRGRYPNAVVWPASLSIP